MNYRIPVAGGFQLSECAVEVVPGGNYASCERLQLGKEFLGLLRSRLSGDFYDGLLTALVDYDLSKQDGSDIMHRMLKLGWTEPSVTRSFKVTARDEDGCSYSMFIPAHTRDEAYDIFSDKVNTDVKDIHVEEE